jgi:hypothetical protein
MSRYTVLIDDNFHYQDESERITHGTFATAVEAIAECKRIVDEDLKGLLQPGITAPALYARYMGFGDGPFVVPVDPNDPRVPFSAPAYAEQRCKVMGAKTPILIPADEDVTAEYAGTVFSIVGVKPTK